MNLLIEQGKPRGERRVYPVEELKLLRTALKANWTGVFTSNHTKKVSTVALPSAASGKQIDIEVRFGALPEMGQRIGMQVLASVMRNASHVWTEEHTDIWLERRNGTVVGKASSIACPPLGCLVLCAETNFSTLTRPCIGNVTRGCIEVQPPACGQPIPLKQKDMRIIPLRVLVDQSMARI